MDADLIQVARTLAERGWLPGIDARSPTFQLAFVDYRRKFDCVTVADLHLAAHNEIVRRELRYTVGRLTTSIWDTEYTMPMAAEDGTTTLSLLRALRRACEEHERATQQASEKKETT